MVDIYSVRAQAEGLDTGNPQDVYDVVRSLVELIDRQGDLLEVARLRIDGLERRIGAQNTVIDRQSDRIRMLEPGGYGRE